MPVKLAIAVDIKGIQRELNDVQKKQLPFAMSLAINNTLKAAQFGVRQSLDRNFTIAPSRKAFLARTIRIARDGWATKKKLEGRLDVGLRDKAYSAKDRSFLLGRHEEGGSRSASDPSEPFYIPTNALRKSDTSLVPQRMYPRALRLYDRRSPDGILPGQRKVTKKGRVQRQGKRSTFIIDNSTPGRDSAHPMAHGIYERYGPGRRQIRMLWAFRTRITLRPRLRMYETVKAIHAKQFDQHFDAAMAKAVATAR